LGRCCSAVCKRDRCRAWPGLFINTLPVRLSIGEQSVEQALRATHERLGRLLRHEHRVAGAGAAVQCGSGGAAVHDAVELPVPEGSRWR